VIFDFNIGGTLQHAPALRYGVKPYRSSRPGSAGTDQTGRSQGTDGPPISGSTGL